MVSELAVQRDKYANAGLKSKSTRGLQFGGQSNKARLQLGLTHHSPGISLLTPPPQLFQTSLSIPKGEKLTPRRQKKKEIKTLVEPSEYLLLLGGDSMLRLLLGGPQEWNWERQVLPRGWESQGEENTLLSSLQEAFLPSSWCPKDSPLHPKPFP